METRYRALRVVSLILKVIGWIVFVVGGLLALLIVILGAIQGQAGMPSPYLRPIPGITEVRGVVSGLVGGIAILLWSLLQFVFFYAAAEWIDLALAIEANTRETAHYLRGENNIPPPPTPLSWEESQSAGTES